jgi:protein phosphatase-4 regulatory subunit 3
MKAIISDMFDKYEPVMIRLAERPFVRACVLGLRARWDQNREPPPQPTLQAADSNQARTAAEEEEAWFNRSDEEGTSGSNVVPVKRKRPQQKRKSPAKGALGLDYDESDSEGSVEGDSPKVTETTQLAEDLTDVELKIRAKRQRAEQEEEEDGAMAGLLGKPGAVGRKLRGEKSEQKSEQKGDEGEAAGGSNQVKDKKIRLSLTGLGKKLGRT